MITVSDIAYVRYRPPDLARMERFLLDFRLRAAARTRSALYVRAAGAEPYAHITELGELSPGIGVGLLAQRHSCLAVSARVAPQPSAVHAQHRK
jgi:hypothetical protein